MLPTVSSATFTLVLVLLSLIMTVGADPTKYRGVFMIFKYEKTGNEENYACSFGGERSNITEIQQMATPTKVSCQPSGTGAVSCKFKDKVGCQDVQDECTKKLEGKYFRSAFPGGPCPDASA